VGVTEMETVAKGVAAVAKGVVAMEVMMTAVMVLAPEAEMEG